MGKQGDPIKVKSRWVTGAWRHTPRYLTITKVDGDDIDVQFDDGQVSSMPRSAFHRTFVKVDRKQNGQQHTG